MPEVLTFDPTDENSGSQLQVTLGTDANYSLLEQTYPAAPLVTVPAGSIDTEGERIGARKHGNRTITHRWDVLAASEGALETAVNALTAKVAKLGREGGTFRRTSAAGEVRTYDVLAADDWTRPLDITYYTGRSASVSYSLLAKPYSRGAEQDLGDNVETTLPVLIFTEATIPGDVDALGRLVIDNDSAGDQHSVVWGIESVRYNTAGDPLSGLFFEAEAHNPGGGTTTADATASGGSMVRANLSSTVEASLIGAGTLPHVGVFRCFVRAKSHATNTGVVSLRLFWRHGVGMGGNYNAYVPMPYEGVWQVLDLGMVHIVPRSRGTHTWQAWVSGISTVTGDDVDVDCMWLVPCQEGSGQTDSLDTDNPPLFGSQNMQVSHAEVITKANTGDFWHVTQNYRGDYLLVPSSGAEARPVRVIVKASRDRIRSASVTTALNAGGDVLDDISARFYVIPRYLT